MSSRVFVRLTIPFASLEGFNDAIEFSHWLPLNSDDRISIDLDDMSIVLRFDQSCGLPGTTLADAQIATLANPTLWRILVQVELSNLSSELIAGIRPWTHEETTEDMLYSNPHRTLAKQVVGRVLEYVNRLIACVRSHKRQYWLHEFGFDAVNIHSYLVRFGAEIKVEGGEWQRWAPPGIGGVWTARGCNPTYRPGIGVKDWPEIVEFVKSGRKPRLVRELLAGAEVLAETGQNRAALTEAVTALEVCIDRFAKSPAGDALYKGGLADRLSLESLSSIVDHLGFTATVSYLLPLILPETTVASDLLRECAVAIHDRQNVVHGGQRDVDPKKTQRHLSSINALCQTLEQLTVANAEMP